MSLSSAIAEYQTLVSTQPQPNKKQSVQLRKSLMTIKRCCDVERRTLLPAKVFNNKSSMMPEEEVPEPPVSPMDPVVELEKLMPLPLVREMSVNVASSQPVEDIKIDVISDNASVKMDKKKKRKTTKNQKTTKQAL
jgi:hypothetical protein